MMKTRTMSDVWACLTTAFALVGLLLTPLSAHGQDVRISVNADQITNHIMPWMYGSCIEDVNHEIYGGLYDQKIFGESFEEPPLGAKFAGWTAYGGDWQAQGQIVQVSTDAGGKLVRAAPAFGDGSVETEVRFPNGIGGNAGLLVRVSEAGVGADVFNGYEISLSRDRVILGKHRQNWQPLQDAAAAFTSGEWTRLRVESDGVRIRVFVNGGTVPAIDFTDTDRPLLSGTFALRTWNSDATFRNVRVQTGATPTEIPFKVTAGSDPVSGMWDAVQTGSAPSDFLRDAHDPYNGVYCQRVWHGVGAGVVGVANRGLNRWGIAVQKGRKLGGRLYLRGDVRGAVTLALQSADGSRTYATQTIRRITDLWAKFPIALTPSATDPRARFAVLLDKPGTLWLDQVVLTGEGAAQFKGLSIRADIARQIHEEGVTFLRYGGTMVNVPGYRWENMIGAPDKRPPYKGNWYPYSTNGFGIEEFVRFCEAAKIEAAFAVNIEETPQDMADMVDYLNDPVTTPWGKRRAQNGHAAPYHVRWIEIGNEEVLGGDNAAEYDHYIQRFSLLEAAIHAKDPKIQLVCAAWWRPDSANVERVFKAFNGKAAFWDLHVGGDDPRAGEGVDRDLTQMQALFQKWAPGTSMKCVIFEENGGLHNQQRALGHATILNATRRHGDFVTVSCPANALQPWRQNDNGWDQGQIFFTPSQVWGMPPFYAQQMAAQNHLPLRVQSVCEGSADLDVTATRSEDGRTLALHVVNTGAAPRRAAVFLDAFPGVQPAVHVWTLAADPKAVNLPDGPETVRPQERIFSSAGAQFDYTFPAHSYTILRLLR